jgi:hypothetical protein
MGILNKNTLDLLKKIGSDIVKYARINLNKNVSRKSRTGKTYNGKISSSGKLSDSLEYVIKGNNLIIEAVDYAEYVDKGRKPGKGVPLNNLEKWIKEKPVRMVKKGKYIKMEDKDVKNYAGYISWKIKNYGIDPTNFLTDAIEKSNKENKDNLVKSLGNDIKLSLNDILIKKKK